MPGAGTHPSGSRTTPSGPANLRWGREPGWSSPPSPRRACPRPKQHAATACPRPGQPTSWPGTGGGRGCLRPRSRRPKAASPRAPPVEVRDLILRLRKKLRDAGLDAGPNTIARHLEHHHGRGHLPLDHQPTPGSRGTGGRRAGMTGRGDRAVSSDSPRATSARRAAARRSGRSVRGSRSGPSSRARTA
jgi:hypothetical protein